jgi:hypothetical protein
VKMLRRDGKELTKLQQSFNCLLRLISKGGGLKRLWWFEGEVGEEGGRAREWEKLLKNSW